MRSPIFDITLACIGLLGFILAAYIYHCKRKKKPLICPLQGSCDAVTTSRYSQFFGIPVEVLGMIFYGVVMASHILMLVFPSLATPAELELGLILATCAFLFSIYLISIQAFVLRHWCTWCLSSAFLCALIFLIAYLSAPVGFF